MVTIDQIVVDTMLVGLESNYLRFEATEWYKFDPSTDSYIRQTNSDILEAVYAEEKNNG